MRARPTYWFTLSLLITVLCTFSAGAQPISTTGVSTATRIYVGTYLHDISNLSLNDGTYDIDADLWVKWRGEFDPNEIRFANAAEFERDVLATTNDDDWHSARWRIRGTFRGDFPVKRFPFDTQRVAIQLELPRQMGDLTPDLAGSGISSSFSITDWTWSRDFRPVIRTHMYPSDLGSITHEGRPSEVRQVGFEVSLSRPLMPVILKLFLPLLIVAFIVFLSLFVPLATLQPSLTMCVTGLVAVFAFQFSVSDVMPSVAYLTLADVLFITVYMLAVCCVLIVVTSHVLHVNDRTRLATRIRKIARIALPIGFGFAVWLAIPFKPIVEANTTTESTMQKRHASTRSTLRIGTTMPLRLASSPIGAASIWGLSYFDTHHRIQPLALDRMPRIDNDGLRFLADGSLEVTWTLRQDARWSDGSPIVLDDLLLPLAQQKDVRIVETDAVDTRTLVIRWRSRVVDALRPPALWPSTYLKQQIDINDKIALQQARGYGALPTTGPYQTVHVSEKKIIAVRNPYFALSPAPIARVELTHYPDAQALRKALLAGEIDIITPNSLDGDDAEVFVDHPSYQKAQAPIKHAVFLAVPLQDTAWQELDARIALTQAIDRSALARIDGGHDDDVAHSPNPDMRAHNKSRLAHNITQAADFFEAWPDEQKTIPLYWSLPMNQKVVRSLVDDLQRVGFTVEPQQVESTWPMWLGQSHDGFLLHSLRVDSRADAAQWWALPSISNRVQREERHVAWTDETHAWVDQYEHALFPERRTQLKEHIDHAWEIHLPMIPLYFAQQAIIVSRALHGWNTPSEQLFGQTMDNWYFDDPSPSLE